jgi:hypothetical protein
LEKSNRTPGVLVILIWMVINVVFMVLELTVFGDSADLNNSILLILWTLSIVGLISMRKLGAAVATFTLIYAFSFNSFNLVYFFVHVFLLNGLSAIINAVAIAYLFQCIFKNKFR